MSNDRKKMKWWDKFCGLQSYSFIRVGADPFDGVTRVPDNSGNWLDRHDVEKLADEVQSRINELEAENACLEQERDQLKSQVTLQQAANAACQHLPEGWQISLNLEKDAGCFELTNPDGDEIDPVAFQGESLAEELNEMLNIANGFSEEKLKYEVLG